MTFARKEKPRQTYIDAKRELDGCNKFLATKLGLPMVTTVIRRAEVGRKPLGMETAKTVNRVRLTYLTSGMELRSLDMYADSARPPDIFVRGGELIETEGRSLVRPPSIIGVSFVFVDGSAEERRFRLGLIAFGEASEAGGSFAAEFSFGLSTLHFSLRRVETSRFSGRREEVEADRLSLDLAKLAFELRR